MPPKKDEDKYYKYLRTMMGLVDYNKERHNLQEKALKMVKGGKDQWDPSVWQNLYDAGRPIETNNIIHRNVNLHAGYYVQNSTDIKFEGSNENLNSPIDLANAYHFHVKNVNDIDFLNLKTYTYGIIFEGIVYYDFEMGADGAKEIIIKSSNTLGVYKDPQCDDLDYCGPSAKLLGWAKFTSPDDLIRFYPELKEELADNVKEIKKRGFTYNDKIMNDTHLRSRAGDFYDTMLGMMKIYEIWDYEYKNRYKLYDNLDGSIREDSPQSQAARDIFMSIPGNNERYTFVPGEQKVLMRRQFSPCLPGWMIVDEPHRVQVRDLNGKIRMPAATFTALEVDNEAKGYVLDAVDMQKHYNSILSNHLYTSIMNTSTNKFYSTQHFRDPAEAERYRTRCNIPGEPPYDMKPNYKKPESESPDKMDAESHKIADMAPEFMSNVMMTPKVLQGEQEKQETLGQWEGRQNAALTNIAMTFEYWKHHQKIRGNIEISMQIQLGKEKVMREIDSGPTKDMLPKNERIIVNQQLEDGSTFYDLSQLKPSKVVTIQSQHSNSYSEKMLSNLAKTLQLVQDPIVVSTVMPDILRNLPLPAENRERLAENYENALKQQQQAPKIDTKQLEAIPK